MKTALEWAADEGLSIIEPNGWIGGPSLDTPITYEEYRARMLNSVVGPMPQENYVA